MIPRYAEAGTTDGVLTGQQVQAFRRDGYVVVPGLFSAAEIAERREALSFLHVPIFPGVFEKLSRPTITPADVAVRLRKFLGDEKATR